MKILRFLSAVFVAAFCCPEIYCDDAVKVQIGDWFGLDREMVTIRKAAERNDCEDEDFLLLLAIRKQENGRPGREFGILHPRCLVLIKKCPEKSLDIQAGWAAATIIKNRLRWARAGCKPDFITFLGNCYCPFEIDPVGNINWKKNVRFWFEKFKQARRPLCLFATHL